MQLTLRPSSLTKKPLRRLNCSPSFLRSISGLAPRESEQLLNMLWEHATRPEFVYRHKWQTGDVVFCPSPTSSRSPQECSWLSLGLVRRQGTTAEHCTSGRRTSPKPHARSSARCTASPPAASLSEASTESPPARSVRREPSFLPFENGAAHAAVALHAAGEAILGVDEEFERGIWSGNGVAPVDDRMETLHADAPSSKL